MQRSGGIRMTPLNPPRHHAHEMPDSPTNHAFQWLNLSSSEKPSEPYRRLSTFRVRLVTPNARRRIGHSDANM